MSDFLVKWLKLSLVALVGCGFLAMAIYAFVQQDEIRNAQIEPPLVNAPEEAVKRRPDQPGGMDIPNRDKLVFDLLDSDTVPNAGVAMAPADAAVAANPAAAMLAPAEGQTQAAAPVQEVAVATPAEPVAAQAPVQVAVKPIEQPKTPEPKAEPKKAEAKASGGWGVQLAAVGSKADGDKAVAKLAKQYSALKALSPRVVAAPDGKHFRLQFVGAKDRAAAQAICGKLGKQPCFPVSAK